MKCSLNQSIDVAHVPQQIVDTRPAALKTRTQVVGYFESYTAVESEG